MLNITSVFERAFHPFGLEYCTVKVWVAPVPVLGDTPAAEGAATDPIRGKDRTAR